MKRSHASAKTHERLLEAAGAVFAEKGFRHTTVREICKRAGANVAAVNYHFGSKQALYTAVLKYGAAAVLEKYPPDMDLPANASSSASLHAFIRSLLYRVLDKGRFAWHGRLMAREMVEPTPALDALTRGTIQPLCSRLESIVRSMMPAQTPEEVIRRCCLSIVGQCLFYEHSKPVIQRLFKDVGYAPADIDMLSHHITDFSIAAIRQMTHGKKKPS